MKTKIISAQEIRDVEMSALPLGEHKGVWGGYEVTIKVAGATYHLKTDIGIRTIAAPCVVHVQNGEITVEVV